MRVLLLSVIAVVTACTGPKPEPADFVLTNVNGASMTDEGLVRFDTVAIADGRFVATGSADDLLVQFADAPVKDGGGLNMLPGLIDAHGHVSSLGVVTESINLAGVDSLPTALSIVRDFAAEHPDRPWITGRGWNQVLWEGGAFPTREHLDAVEAERPIWLGRIDGHAAWGNSAALAAAGITRDTADPPGGRIIRDENGDPSGVFVDAAMDLVESAIPVATDEDTARYIEAALTELARLGITSVHDAGVSLQETRVLRQLADTGRLTVRVYAMLSGAGEVLDGFGEPLFDYADGRLSIRSVKLYADGALGSRGAALIDEYADEPGNRGLLFGDENTIASLIRKSNEAGFQANVHAIGDLANRVVLEAFADVQGDRPSELRNRIEHAQIVPVELIADFARLGVIASMQPTHATSDMNMAEDRIGSLRIRGAYAWRTMLEAGAVLAAGSDFPVESANPMFGLHAAVTRTDHQGMPEGGWYPEQALTREEALRAFTIDAAYAAHQENELGQIAPGFRADFILLDRDYWTMPAAELYTLAPAETWIAGERVYQREQTN